MFRCPRTSFLVLLALLLAPGAPAQVDFPDSGKPRPTRRATAQRGDVAPHLTCTVCGERNYTTPVEWDAKNGFQKAYCAVCRTERLHELPRQGRQRSNRGVDLPLDPGRTIFDARRPGTARAPAPENVAPGRPAPEGARVPAGGIEAELGRSASAILTELERVNSLDDARVLKAPDTLLALGEPGLSAARVALTSDRGPLLLTGLRTLLRGGDARDAESVARRLLVRLPGHVASIAVEEFVALDPVRATPEYLVELLAHAQSPVRQAAYRQLSAQRGADLLPYLAEALEAESSDTRRKVVELLSGIDHPEVLDLLLEAIDDARASVALRAVTAVARYDDPRVEPLLFERAFRDRWILRSSAYALLALVEREDLLLRPIFNSGHVEVLLRGLDSNDEFVSAVCASALAGVGFRTEDSEGTEWVDAEVPRRLVQVVAGFQFFHDYEAVRPTAERRLATISGAGFGSDGPAWAEWWLGVADDFRALRAVLHAPEGSERRLRVKLHDGDADGAYALLGPDEAPVGAPASAGEIFYLSEDEARDLLGVIREEGVLSVDRLPGARGSLLERGRSFEISLDGRSKRFAFGFGLGEPWFDRVLGVAASMRERNLWQRFPDPRRHGDRLGLYRSEGAWWATHTDELERRLRLKELVLARMRAVAPEERDDTLEALQGLYAEGAARVEDLEPLLVALGQEPAMTGRARRLAALARRAAGLDPEGTPTETLDADVGNRVAQVVDTLYAEFGEDALEEIGATLAEAGRAAVRDAASDPRPLVRVVAALTLAREPDEGDVAILLGLLEDPGIEVQVAAVEALGAARVEAARDALLVRASLSLPEVRSSALRAIGALGGDDARDLLITTLTSGDPLYRLPAAEGLATLGDPSSASLMVSILRTEPRGELAGVLREGLLGLGEGAWSELFTAMRSPSAELRREASLILAAQNVPGAVPGLIRALAEDPADTRLGRELAILTCVDHRNAVDPAEAWYRWWDEVRHDDSLVWLLAAGEARGIAAPPVEAFRGERAGQRDAIGFLAQVMSTADDLVAERARRELQRMIGRDPGALPPGGPARDAWLSALLEVLDEAR